MNDAQLGAIVTYIFLRASFNLVFHKLICLNLGQGKKKKIKKAAHDIVSHLVDVFHACLFTIFSFI